MFTTKIEALSDQINKYRIFQNEVQLTYYQVINLLQNNKSFRVFYNAILVETPFKAYFWENPPITNITIHQLYEFVLVNSDTLSRVRTDKHTFSTYFNQSKNGVVRFENLRKDALLVVPSPVNNAEFPHISAFVRKAVNEQMHAFWKQVGREIEDRISNEKLWVSTSGLGVYWLHVRLDNRPKYYTFRSYRIA